MRNEFSLPVGTIYGDTGNIEEELENLAMTDCSSREEFIEELASLSDIINLNKYEKFIYQDKYVIFQITYEELYKELI